MVSFDGPFTTTMASSHYDVLIIGGGTAGIMTAAQLRRKDKDLRIAIIDPSQDPWYQPAWTLVAADVFNMKDTRRDEASVIPPGLDLIREHASAFEPEANTVRTQEGRAYTYGHLVVAPGIQMNIHYLPGLRDALATDKV